MRPSPSKALSKNTKLNIFLLSPERNCFYLCVLFSVCCGVIVQSVFVFKLVVSARVCVCVYVCVCVFMRVRVSDCCRIVVLMCVSVCVCMCVRVCERCTACLSLTQG